MSDKTVNRWPGYCDEAHPEIFTTVPSQPQRLKPGQLTEEKVKKFFEEGFLIIDSFFQPGELDPCKTAVDEQVDMLASKLLSAGKITNLYKEHGFDTRLTMIENEFPGANIILHRLGQLPKAFQDIWANERLLNVAEQILGTSDIAGHPVWNLRTKTPNNEPSTVPWHQDSAYLDKRAYTVLQLTAWIPLMNATEQSGCMQVVRYGHRAGRVATHTCCAGDTWYVSLSEDEMRNTLGCNLEKDIVTVPVNYGSVLLLNNLTPHCSLNNAADCIRWSLDFRWQAADKSPGFYDIKGSVKLRSSTDPDFQPDWDSYVAVTRQEVYIEEKQAEFDTTIAGPWMLNWEMTHTNRHTDALKKGGVVPWHMIVG